MSLHLPELGIEFLHVAKVPDEVLELGDQDRRADLWLHSSLGPIRSEGGGLGPQSFLQNLLTLVNVVSAQQTPDQPLCWILLLIQGILYCRGQMTENLPFNNTP